MKIDRVVCQILRIPNVQSKTASSQDAVLVRIRTDDGLEGVGEADSSPEVVKAIVDAPFSHNIACGLRELLVGENLLDHERLWHKMYRRTMYFGRKAVGITAMAAVDMALWDLKGKAFGQPIHRLLGGKQHDRLRGYASILFGRDRTETAEGQEKKASPPKTAPAKDAPVVPPREGQSETKKLFDGTTLAGWEGYSDLWSVKDGVIVARNDKPLKFSTYLLTAAKYTDFRLTFSAKLVESEMHSGVCFWGEVRPTVSKDPEADRTKFTYAGHLVMFPSGWGMYDLFGRNGLPVSGAPAKKVGRQHDWNEIEVLAQGNRVRVAANGTAVVDWRDPEPNRIKAGPIGLQLHSNTVPQEVQFKGLVLETFPKEDKLLTLK